MIFVWRKLFRKNIAAIALFPFIFVCNQTLLKDRRLINHEKIHLRQQLEMLVLPFYIWYLVEYLIRLIHYKKSSLAYRNISFEREAYENDYNINYLKERSFFQFIKYL